MSGKNRTKGLVIALIIIMISSLSFNLYQSNKTKELDNRIKNKDKAITEIRKVLKTITATKNTIDSIKIALGNDFKIDSEVIFNDSDSSFYFVVSPKDWNVIDYHEIWDFYGLEIVCDINGKFKRIDFYKP